MSSQRLNREFWKTGLSPLSGRKEERGVDYFGGLLRETNEKEFCFRESEKNS